jgi:hypothetical protein
MFFGLGRKFPCIHFVTYISNCHRFIDPIYGNKMYGLLYSIYTIYFNLDNSTVSSTVFYSRSLSIEYSTVLNSTKYFLSKYKK